MTRFIAHHPYLAATLTLVAAACQNGGDGSLEEAPPDTAAAVSDSADEEALVIPTRATRRTCLRCSMPP